MSKHSESDASAVPKQAKQDAQAHGQEGSWVEACVWSERMLAALDNGVKGGQWFSLKRWPNAYFAELGLFTMTEAHTLASQSR